MITGKSRGLKGCKHNIFKIDHVERKVPKYEYLKLNCLGWYNSRLLSHTTNDVRFKPQPNKFSLFKLKTITWVLYVFKYMGKLNCSIQTWVCQCYIFWPVYSLYKKNLSFMSHSYSWKNMYIHIYIIYIYIYIYIYEGRFFFNLRLVIKKTPMNIKNLFYYQKKGNFLHYFST